MQNSNKCPNCGGFYVYSPKDYALKCTNCGGIKKIEESSIYSHKYDDNKSKFNNEWATTTKQVKCSECGAQMIVNKLSLVDKCDYCGGVKVVDVKNATSISPDAVVPYAFDSKDAKTRFKTELCKKLFVPNILKKQTPELHVANNYISSYVFNGSLIASYSGVLEYSSTETDSDGNSSTVYYKKKVSGEINHAFADYIVESSEQMTQEELKQILPFKLDASKGYNADYLLGASAEYCDKSLVDANLELENALRIVITNRILRKHNCDRVVTLNLNLNFERKDYIYCLLPTYLFNYDYKEKHYKTVMNGQTGQLGGGVPRSPIKITLFVLFILLLVCGIPLLVYLLG